MVDKMIIAAAAASAVLTATAAGAATLKQGSNWLGGYEWRLDDGSRSFSVEIRQGEDFFDLIEEGLGTEYATGRLALAAAEGLGSYGTYFGVTREYVGGELYQDKNIEERVEVDGGVCEVLVTNLYDAQVSFVTGALTYEFERRVLDVEPSDEGVDCSSVPGSTFDISDPMPGTWFALGMAPAYPFGADEPSPVPLPSGAPLLLLGVASFSALRRRGKATS